MRIVKYGEGLLTQEECSKCKSVIEYTKYEVKNYYNYVFDFEIHEQYIMCPVCGDRIVVRRTKIY